MDSGESELESTLSPLGNPCLIVEDSQPDSAALEEDPDTNYRALLARRLSAVQPASPSPVLELISPAARRGSQSDSGITMNSKQPTSSSTREASQVFDVRPPANRKTDVSPANGNLVQELGAEADSATHCAPSEGEASQFGFLQLSETQGFGDGLDDSQEGHDADSSALGPAGEGDVHMQTKQGKASESQTSITKRSELSPVSSSEPVDLEKRERTIQSLLGSQDSQPKDLEDDKEMLSSQDDMFAEGGDTGGKDLPIATPANSLHLLHLSGQGTLVQESLSQNSEFVAPTQDNLSQAPLIVPNSPTAQDEGQGAEEGVNASLSPDDSKHLCPKEEVPVKALPSESTPVTENVQALVVENALPMPSQPNLSHDIFVPSQSQEGEVTGSHSQPLKNLPVSNPSISSQSQQREMAESFHLGLAADTENSSCCVPAETMGLEEDSQATQIEDLVDADTTGSPCSKKERLDDHSQICDVVESAHDPEEISRKKGVETSEVDSSTDAVLTTPAVTDLSQKISSSKEASSGILALEADSQSVICPTKAEVVLVDLKAKITEADIETDEKDVEEGDEREQSVAPGLCFALSQSQLHSPEPMEESSSYEEQNVPKENPLPLCSEKNNDVEMLEEESDSVTVVVDSQPTSQKRDEGFRDAPGKGTTSPAGPKDPTDVGDARQTQDSRNEATSHAHLHSEKAKSAMGAEEVSGSRSPNDSSGEIQFNFTLPKEGELITPAASVTPPLVKQLKQTPRHSTPIETSSFSERMAEEVSGEATMPGSEISVEESEGAQSQCGTVNTTEHEEKLSLRMKLVTPVEEGSSGSGHFSLPRPTLLDEEDGSVSKVTTVVKAVSSSLPSPSVFNRVCEARRQMEEEQKMQTRELSTPTRSDVFNSPLSQGSYPERNVPALQAQRPKTLPRSNAIFESNLSEEHSPSSLQEGIVLGGSDGNAGHKEAEPRINPENKSCTVAIDKNQAGDARPQHMEVEASNKSQLAVSGDRPMQRAVSQQTSFDISTPSSIPNKLLHKAVSLQTSFDAPEVQDPANRGEAEMPSPQAAPGQSVRRHVRTIREVRTTVTRIITDVYYEDGQEVDRKVSEEMEEPVVDCRVIENDISPSRTGSSMTSGDLADISSFSSKTSSLQHSSSGTSSAGTGHGKRPDFVAPVSRGVKPSSPRKLSGQQQRAHCGPGVSDWMSDTGGTRGSLPLTKLSPHGRARRGKASSCSPLSRNARNVTQSAAQGPVLSSSEDEPYTRVYTRRTEAGSPDIPLETSGGPSSFVGLRVVAKWSSNGYFYSGRITRDCGESRFRLLFDDSYECDVQGKDILLCDPIPLETEVTALSEDEYFSTGVVKGHKAEGADLFYCVEKDGQQKWYGRMAVILSMEQGNRLREQYGLGPYEPVTPLTKASDISLDNLVEGKRKRRGIVSSGGSLSRNSSDSPKTPGPSGKRKLSATFEEHRTPSKRGRKSAGVRMGQRVNVCNTSGSGTDLPSDSGDLVETHGPLPQTASLFIGYAFLLTTSSELDRERNQPTSDGEEDVVQMSPYNKQYTENQLKAGGGYVLNEFNEELCSAAYQSILVADQHCRTQKYLLCVASGIPCVSHAWVRDCCHGGKLLSYKSYLLPAGMGPDDRLVEWHPRCSPFQDMKVLLALSGSTDFLADLLKKGEAAAVHVCTEDNLSDLSVESVHLVVTDRSCPSAVLSSVRKRDLPMVSAEWLIHSIICGEKLAFDSQYRYDDFP